jgi:hypothetical protein
MTTLIPKYDQGATGAVNRPINEKLAETVSVKDFGAIGNGVADDAGAIQAAITYLHSLVGGTLIFPAGTYKIGTAIDCYPTSSVRLVLQGEGQGVTTITTVENITLFTHAESFECYDLSVYQLGTAKTGVAFATSSTKQAAYCRYERCTIDGFKFGIWWRFSLWNSLRDMRFNNCACGLKASRNALINDQTNPAAPASWNTSSGFFHNQNTFDNVLCNGGEVGIYGTFNGNVFSNVTCQGQSSSTGASNVVLPIGQQGTGLLLQNNGSNTSTFGSQANAIVNYYSELTRQPIVLEYVQVSLSSVYYQGGASSDKYPQAIKVTGGVLNARGCVNTGADWFDYRMVATDATIYGDPTAGTTSIAATLSGAYSLTNTDWFQTGVNIAVTKQYTSVGASTTALVSTMENKNTYSVEVVAIYDGSQMRSARFQVAYYNSAVAARVISDAGNSADITCTTSGATININTTGGLTYIVTATAIQNRKLGAFPYVG